MALFRICFVSIALRFSGCVCFLLFGLMASHARADTTSLRPVLLYDLGQGRNWVPYQSGREPGTAGVFMQIIDKIGEHSGISFKTVNLPAKRGEKALTEGLIDFDFHVVEWLENQDVNKQKYVLSEPLFTLSEFVITLSDAEHEIITRDDYYGKNIGTVAGYFYFDSDKFRRVNFLSEGLLIKGLKKNRFNMIILEKECARYWASVYNVDIRFALEHTKGFIRVRLRKEKQGFMPLINQAIQTIYHNGELQAILDQHDIADALAPPPKPN